jgi:CheY-like chemotaxis protein
LKELPTFPALRVLTVEDQAIEAVALSATLTALGCEVVGHAYTGGGSILMAETLKPNLVLMDIDLGHRTDGLHAAAEIRAKMGIPIVFLTGLSDRGLRAEAEAQKPVAFLEKPCPQDLLESALRAAHLHLKPPAS